MDRGLLCLLSGQNFVANLLIKVKIFYLPDYKNFGRLNSEIKSKNVRRISTQGRVSVSTITCSLRTEDLAAACFDWNRPLPGDTEHPDSYNIPVL